jgi:hypothetical protein
MRRLLAGYVAGAVFRARMITPPDALSLPWAP